MAFYTKYPKVQLICMSLLPLKCFLRKAIHVENTIGLRKPSICKEQSNHCLSCLQNRKRRQCYMLKENDFSYAVNLLHIHGTVVPVFVAPYGFITGSVVNTDLVSMWFEKRDPLTFKLRIYGGFTTFPPARNLFLKSKHLKRQVLGHLT